ncbi:MAG TPA: hypothetical protein VLV50_13510 [Stellaceae bacterium]|nr:hypothetical protein [Stellaceae bacterium]
MADDRIDVVFGAEFSELLSAVQQIKTALDGLAAPAKALGDQFALTGMRMTDGAQAGALSWADALHTIEGDAFTVFDAVLSGTTTWRAAMEKLFADLALSFGEYVAEMVVDWVAFEALGIGGEGAGGSGGAAGGLLGFVAGLFGSGGGAGGAADAGAGLADLAMFQAGAWSIPRDMIAVVHAGEMILPAETAAAARAGGPVPGFPSASATGTSAGANFALNVTVQAIDSAGVAQWANANAKTLAQTITRYMGVNPSVNGV